MVALPTKADSHFLRYPADGKTKEQNQKPNILSRDNTERKSPILSSVSSKYFSWNLIMIDYLKHLHLKYNL